MNISPSIASANPLRLEDAVMKVKDNYKDLHIDIEDGNFVPNITFGLKTIKALRQITDVPFSFHLMVMNPYDYLDEIIKLLPSIIFVQVESIDYIRDFIFKVKSQKVNCGLAFNPKTPIEPYLYLFNEIDSVLIMTSEPDGVGQLFINEMVEKIRMVRERHPSINIWCDGGITRDRFDDLTSAGANTLVLGREIFKEE